MKKESEHWIHQQWQLDMNEHGGRNEHGGGYVSFRIYCYRYGWRLIIVTLLCGENAVRSRTFRRRQICRCTWVKVWRSEDSTSWVPPCATHSCRPLAWWTTTLPPAFGTRKSRCCQPTWIGPQIGPRRRESETAKILARELWLTCTPEMNRTTVHTNRWDVAEISSNLVSLCSRSSKV